MKDEKPGLWARTKEVAGTYTGTFIVVMILNQLLFFGFCLNPICIVAAMPHVLLITVALGTFINKMSDWGTSRLFSRTTKLAGAKTVEIGRRVDAAVTEFERTAKELEEKSKVFHEKELEKLKLQRIRNKETLDNLLREIERTNPRSKSSSLNERIDSRLPDGTSLEKRSDTASSPSSKRVTEIDSLTNPASEESVICHNTELKKTKENTISKGLDFEIHKPHIRAYITNSNLSKILNSLDLKGVPHSDFDSLYKKNLRGILSQRELALLCVYKEICEDPEQAFESYSKIYSQSDNPKFVFKSGSPSYHIDRQCDLLHGDYFNLIIPPEISARGESEITRFTEFCRDHRLAIEEETYSVMRKMEAQFFLKNLPKKLIAKNSGVAEITNLNLESLEKRIDGLLEDAEGFRKRSSHHQQLIQKFGYADEAIGLRRQPTDPVYIWTKFYKIPLKQLLRDYFRVKFNSDLSFDGFLLEKLGFNPCRKCSSGFAIEKTKN